MSTVILSKITLNLLAILIAFGITAYGTYLYKVFRGGVFAKPFRILVLAPFLFLLAGVSDLIGVVFDLPFLLTVVHDLFQLAFLAMLSYAMFQFYSSWKRFASGKEPA
jgi:hypothetical protein